MCCRLAFGSIVPQEIKTQFVRVLWGGAGLVLKGTPSLTLCRDCVAGLHYTMFWIEPHMSQVLTLPAIVSSSSSSSSSSGSIALCSLDTFNLESYGIVDADTPF